jgi:hypothetical protein
MPWGASPGPAARNHPVFGEVAPTTTRAITVALLDVAKACA